MARYQLRNNNSNNNNIAIYNCHNRAVETKGESI